jgi:hypothetical protein
MKRYYWAGDAVVSLFLGDQHRDFLLSLAGKCGPVYTASATAGEFRLKVALADRRHELRHGAVKKLTAAFHQAVEAGNVVLIPEDLATLADDAMTHPDAVRHISDPMTLLHLVAARKGRYQGVVTCDAKLGRVCPTWGLQPVTPAVQEEEEIIEPYRDRLRQCRILLTQMVETVTALKAECEAAKADHEALLSTVPEHERDGYKEELDEALGDFIDAVEEETDVGPSDGSASDVALAAWEEAFNQLEKTRDTG